MNKQDSEIEFSDYLYGGAWFPDELFLENEVTGGGKGTVLSSSNTEYVDPPSYYLEFLRLKDSTNN